MVFRSRARAGLKILCTFFSFLFPNTDGIGDSGNKKVDS